MRFFPADIPGLAIQYPVKRRRSQRAIHSVTPGGMLYRSIDPGHRFVGWDLTFQNVTLSQRQELDDFFSGCEGRMQSFVFLDPFQNLVRHSEEFEHGAWEKDPSIVVLSNQPDPMGSSQGRRLSNASGIAGAVVQRLSVPAWFSYTISCWMRATVPTNVELCAHPAGTGGNSLFVTTTWQIHVMRVHQASNETEIYAGLRLPSNSEIHAYGFQMEQFSSLSDYKRTVEEGGVITNSRFDQDEIRWVTSGIDHHSTRIAIHAPLLP